MTRITRMTHALLLACALGSAGAHAEGEDDARRAQAEALRAELASEVQLRAYDLLDELVYQWTQTPPFAQPTPVVLADVTAPVGFNSGLEALIENHVAELLVNNSPSNVRLVHCPACSAMTSTSTKEGTVVSRGIDQPELLQKIGATSGSTHALFLDVEAEGSTLVLRARICAVEKDLPIVYARTVSSATSSAPLLRSPQALRSAEDTKKEYVGMLERRGPLLIPVRLSISQFAPSPDTGVISTVPMAFLQSGVEVGISHARPWVGSVTVGAMWVPQIYTAGMVQGRIGRLITGSSISLTHPDVYAFVGASLIGVNGPAALVLSDDNANVAELIAAATQVVGVMAFYPTFQTGLDVRVNNRVGAGVFVETAPTLSTAQAIGRWLDFAVVQVHSIGGEVTLWF